MNKISKLEYCNLLLLTFGTNTTPSKDINSFRNSIVGNNKHYYIPIDINGRRVVSWKEIDGYTYAEIDTDVLSELNNSLDNSYVEHVDVYTHPEFPIW